MLGAVARAGSSLLAVKSVEKLGNESLKVISLYNGSSEYCVFKKSDKITPFRSCVIHPLPGPNLKDYLLS